MAVGRELSPLTRAKQDAFLASLAQGWSATRSAEAAGLTRQRFYQLRDQDEDFAREWAEAHAAGTDVVVDEVRRRAVEGWDEPVFQGGQQIGVIRKYSDAMLGLLVKQRDQSFREKTSLDVTTSSQVNVQIEDRSATFDAIARVLNTVGAIDSSGAPLAALPAARPVLPAPTDG